MRSALVILAFISLSLLTFGWLTGYCWNSFFYICLKRGCQGCLFAGKDFSDKRRYSNSLLVIWSGELFYILLSCQFVNDLTQNATSLSFYTSNNLKHCHFQRMSKSYFPKPLWSSKETGHLQKKFSDQKVFWLFIIYLPSGFCKSQNSFGGRFYLTIRAHVPTGLQDSSEVIENEELSGFLKDLLELVKKVQSCDIWRGSFVDCFVFNSAFFRIMIRWIWPTLPKPLWKAATSIEMGKYQKRWKFIVKYFGLHPAPRKNKAHQPPTV